MRRTEDILWLSAVWIFCFTYQWEQDQFRHQGLWCFELQGVDRGGLAWLTLSCSFVYFNSYSQEYSELTALPLKLARRFSESGMEHLVLLFVFTFKVKKKKRKSSLFAFRNLPLLNLRSSIQSETPLFSTGNADTYNWGFPWCGPLNIPGNMVYFFWLCICSYWKWISLYPKLINSVPV